MTPEPDRLIHTQATEWGTTLVLLPVTATLVYHVLPPSFQQHTVVQFAPQILAYLALATWVSHNTDILSRLGLEKEKLAGGLRVGIVTGLLLGGLNTVVILFVYPALGYDIMFLKTTPHGQLPPMLMVPWVIVGIALLVELNFRGFILGRLARLEARFWRSGTGCRFPPLALLAGTLIFAFDPFLMHTFRHLHWIAVWDGLIWGTIRLGTGNLYAAIVAHAVEVMVMYLAVRAALG